MPALAIQFDPSEHLTLVELRADLNLREQVEAAADFARQDIEVVQRYNEEVTGFRSPCTVTVDGRRGAPLESVKPDGGEIVVDFQLGGNVIGWIGQTLLDRSPYLKGEYRRGHTVIVDGREHPIGEPAPIANEAVFFNSVKYARRLELGKTESGRDFLVSVPNRIYQRTAQDARRMFGESAQIIFGFRDASPAIFVRMRSNPFAIRSNPQTALRLLG